jgi:hypothetical protein
MRFAYSPGSGSMAALTPFRVPRKGGAVACRLIHDVKNRNAPSELAIDRPKERYRTK